ncbi:hypothetical protein LY78DRAFT_92321 [Colletotrichum sublineola]|nr:hypothetical protein LY78DRAFT_92321 [Colletotrichum sublineola]
MQGIVTRQEGQANNQRLTSKQETQLVNWALSQGASGLPSKNQQLEELAQRVLAVEYFCGVIRE